MFLEKGGIRLYLDVLNKYEGHSAVETKILGLLNNIAEVPFLRQGLMFNDVVAALRSLLHSEHIDVSYFAAGIFSHLISDGMQIWNGIDIPRVDVISDLLEAVVGWRAPEIEMVAYRSFSPFLPLLACHETPEVQIWSVWAIHHVCSKNPKRYCEMLLEEQTLKLFRSVAQAAEVTNNVRLLDYCKQTVDIIRSEYPHLSKEII
jgi:Zyg-11 family protein